MRRPPTAAAWMGLILIAGCGADFEPGRTYALAEPISLWADPPILDPDSRRCPTAGHLIDEYRGMMGPRSGREGGRPDYARFAARHAAPLREGDLVRVLGRGSTPAGVPTLKLSVERSDAAPAGAVGHVVASWLKAAPAD